MKSSITFALTAATLWGCHDAVEPALSPRLAADAAAPADSLYSYVELGSLGGGATAQFINDAGQVAGVSATAAGGTHAFVWQDGQMRDVGTLGGSDSRVSGMNGRGQIVGVSATANGEMHAFRWTDGTMEDVGPVGQGASQVFINQRGEVAWTAPTPSGPHAMLWSGGSVTDLGTLGGSSSVAGGINERGDVVGTSATSVPGEQDHAFVWAHGVMQDLGTLGGASSLGLGLDDRGQAMGLWSAGNDWPGSIRGFLWDHGQMSDLGLLQPYLQATEPVAMNQRGDIIGQSWQAAYFRNSERAFLWRDGVMSALPDPPHDPYDADRNLKATALNDRGQIVGTYSSFAINPPHPVHLALVWQDGIVSLLPTPSPTSEPAPLAINNGGEIVGGVWHDGASHAALWRPTGPGVASQP